MEVATRCASTLKKVATQSALRKGGFMAIHLLTARQVQTAAEGDHSDGGGLVLKVGAGRGRWLFRYTSPAGVRRAKGLGAVHRDSIAAAGRSLAAAREAADKARKLLASGVDPIEATASERERARKALHEKKMAAKSIRATLARVARAYHERVIEGSRSTKHAAQWIASLELNIPTTVWDKPIAEVTAPELLAVLIDLQARIPETASRVRQRLDAIFEDAVFHGLTTTNPAATIRRKLREARGRRTRGQFRALDYADAPRLIARLKELNGISARALEFAILTAARTGEVLGATWEEFDLHAATWTAPRARMKGGEEHVVHLSSRAIAILEAQRSLRQRHVFPAPALDGKQLSNMAMLMLLRRLGVEGATTVHGLCRSTFSTWANETGAARPDVIEACLAHREANRVRAAYNRAQFNAERRRLLDTWAAYLEGRDPATNVIELASAKAS
jgi:integrase